MNNIKKFLALALFFLTLGLVIPINVRTAPATDVSSQVTIIGDSITAMSKSRLQSQLPNAIIDGVGNRTFNGTRPEGAIAALRRLKGKGQLRPILVFAIGTNGGLTSLQIEQVLREAPDSKVIFVTIYNRAVPGYAVRANDAIKAAASGNPNKVSYADWNAVPSSTPGLMVSDGFHPNSAGTVKFAEVITAKVNEAQSGTDSLPGQTSGEASLPIFSNCAVTKIGTPATEPVLPPECAIGASGAIPSADRAALLAQVKGFTESGKIQFAHSNDREGMTNDSGQVRRSDGAMVEIDTQVLRSFVYIADQGITFTVSSLIGNHTKNVSGSGNQSRHWEGHAYDVSIVNGQVINQASAKTETVKFMQAFNALIGKDLVPRQLICTGNGRLDPDVIKLAINKSVSSPGFFVAGHDNHIHVGY